MEDFIKAYKDVLLKGAVLLLTIVAGGLLLLYPLYEDYVSLEAKLAQTRLDIERQNVFVPEYTNLQKKSAVGPEVHFSVPAAEPLAVRDIDVVPATVQRFAEESGLKVLDVVISPSSLRKGDGKLMLQAMTTGDVEDFHTFYAKLGNWGSMDRVSLAEFQATPAGVEYFLELWVHIQGKSE